MDGKGYIPLDVSRTLPGIIFSLSGRLFGSSSLSSFLGLHADAAAGPFTEVELDTGTVNLALSGGSDLDLDGRGCALWEQGFRIARQRPHRWPSRPEHMAPARLHLSQGKGMKSSVS
jgi:hypothetical protein